MIVKIENNSVVKQLVSIQKLFSMIFPVDGYRTDSTSADGIFADSEFIDLSHCIRDTQVTMPTLNG